MLKIRVHELAKELGTTNKELLAKVRATGETVRGPSTVLKHDAVERIRHLYKKGGTPSTTPAPDIDPRDADRLKVARAKVELGIANDYDLHVLRLAEQPIQLLSMPTHKPGPPNDTNSPRPRRKRGITKAKRQRQLNKAKKLASEPRAEAQARAAQRRTERDRQRMFREVAMQSAGGQSPRRPDWRVGSIVLGGLPSLGKRSG
ncbi:translation initiation factor IF-2 N-terminal domain-containing protein [Tessaracoccus sp. MC1756]|uniref:translation initiation factor IF-2 N-terminal domain-containing protein n=1 Tax=Tessaracoccus sp. MC1756 TaxID=2760311 RepID=UPI001603190D|nr:translation initiation factor IF-2 N-terminal domain-containing protein [Tessaracoccus sp. MC1756]